METELENEVPSLLDKLDRPPRPPSEPRATQSEPTNGAARSVATSDAQTLSDWFKQFSGSQIKIALIRQSPEEWNGYNTGGTIAHFDELIDEEQIQARFGGGKYQLKAQQMMPNGRWQFAGARTFKIAGDPIPTGVNKKSRDEQEIPLGPSHADSDVTRAVLGMARDLTKDAQERADRAENRSVAPPSGVPEFMIQLLMEPFKAQITTLSAQVAEKDRIISEKDKTIKDLTERRPDTTLQDTLLNKMYDGESGRVETLRNNFESERRQLIQSHEDQVRRMQDRHDGDLRRNEDSHNREIKSLSGGLEARIESLKSGYESRLEAKDNRIKDLDRDLTKINVELAELKSRKDKTLIDQMSEMAQVKETMQAVGMLGPEAPEEESAMDKAIRVAEPLIKGIGARLEAAPQQVVQQPQARRVTRRPQVSGPPVPTNTAAGAALDLDPGDVAGAVAFMEAAIQNGTQPADFAQSVRNMMPVKVLGALKEQGVDVFLDKVAKLQDNSPLASQVGRNFARKVVRYLLSGTTEEAPTETPSA